MNQAPAVERRFTMIELRGITWGHTRGYLPMVATAQRFSEIHPEIQITWRKRSLQQFADQPIERLATDYDLLVIDHPSCGNVAARGVLLPLDKYLSAEFLAEQSTNSVGPSYVSYSYGGHQWALATDAATPVSGYRRDLLERAGVPPPETWSELLDLARRSLVIVPAIAIDSLMNFFMLCLAVGEEPFRSGSQMVSEDAGVSALVLLKQLLDLCDLECLSRNPIATWDLLARSDSFAYCPFAYGYSNYARAGYAEHSLDFGGLVRLDQGARLRSTLGGAGLAVSSRCEHVQEAMRYCEYVAGAECQRTLYFDSGGQPGHRAAWVDEEVNRRSAGFFARTLATLDEAYLRPRFNGYIGFQDAAGPVVHTFLKGALSAPDAVAELNALWRANEAP
jgi:multiple sugar transport system substrate-binding protein